MHTHFTLAHMPRITATVEDRHEEILSEVDAGNRSEAVRECIEAYERVSELEHQVSERAEEVRAEYEERVAELEQEIERLNRERRQLLEQREENQELVRFADEQRSVVRVQREEERRRRRANIIRRTWWKVAGEPDFDVAAQD
jgi:TolA-binding protein